MKRMVLAGAAATATATAMWIATPVASATSYVADNPPGCTDVNGAECDPGGVDASVPGADASAGPGGVDASVPGADASAGPGGVDASVPGADANAGPGGLNGCINGVGCLDVG